MIKKLARKIVKDLKEPSIEKFYDFFGCLNSADLDDELYELNLKVQPIIKSCMKDCSEGEIDDYYSLYCTSLRYGARRYFEQFLLFMEIDRPPEERFYTPRKKILKRAVDGLQRLADGEIEELFLSMPPRTGKTTLLLFFTTWLAGLHPEKSNLYTAFSDTITKTFYNGLLELMKDDTTYHWEKAFDTSIVKINAQYQTVDVERKKRYSTVTCRSIDGTLNGACDCTGIMIADDLCSGIEEALSKDRMATLWMKVANNLLSRCKKGSKKLWCGTRWSVNDPIGIRQSMLDSFGVEYESIILPALDENGESNFNYKYGVGFDTEFYIQTRAGFEKNDDLASWNAQYMQQPYEREGTLFSSKDLRYYNGDIPGGYASVFMACDPAWGGGDYVAGPVCVQVEDTIYIPDVCYTNEDKRSSLPRLCKAVTDFHITRVRVEANKMTESFAEELGKMLKERGVKCTIETKPAPTNKSKEQRIFDKAPDIRENFVFLSPDKWTKEYRAYMDNVFTFTITGNVKHDDAPDSLAMAADMAYRRVMPAATFKRFF